MQTLVFALFSRFFSNFNSVDGQPSKSRRTTSLNNFGRRPAASNPMFDSDNASRFQDRPPREHDNRREDRGDRENSRNVRDRIGYRENRDRDNRDRSDRNRSDRDRDRKRSPPRRRSRSRSRERRSKQRRSDSPFSVAHENWKKFKQAERVCYVSNVKLDCKFLTAFFKKFE